MVHYKCYVSGYYPSSCFYLKQNVWDIESSSIDWAQLSRFYLKTETEFSLRNVVLNKNRTLTNVQKHIYMKYQQLLLYSTHKKTPGL
jgi:hypothetical protein